MFRESSSNRAVCAGATRVLGTLVRAVILLSLVGAASSCTGSQTQTTNERLERVSERQVDALEADLQGLLNELAENRASGRSVRAILDAPEAELSALELQHLDALRALYAGRDNQLLWVEHIGVSASLSAPGRQLWKVLEDGVLGHAIWPDELHFRELDPTQLPAAQATSGAAFEGVRLSEDERKKVIQWLNESRGANRLVGAPDQGPKALLEELLEDGRPLAHLNTPVEEQAARLTAAARQSSRMDVLLSDALAQYAWRMRFENKAWQKGVHWPVSLRDASEDSAVVETEPKLVGVALTQARAEHLMMRALEGVFDDPAQISSTLESLALPFEPYQRLVRAFRQYTEYAEAGGWPNLPSEAEGLKRGQRNPWVATLKKRLSLEGYYQGDDTELFTQELRRALVKYQNTHQLWANGQLSAVTIRSLNVSALQRRHQIQLTLQRWRESRIGPDAHFVLVNLPDFHASVWRDGERKMYFGVVVGANRRDRKGDFPTATPRFSDEIGYIVFNPYWNVPKEIRLKELEPKQAKDPTYFEREGFEYHTSSNGHRFLRQKPGPTNALGRVKFMFPNQYNIYMHDTPSKSYFKRPHRAYSHGCVRVEDPMTFADYLLDLDGRWMEEKREEKLEKWFEKEGETWVNLRKNLPVHIEYYVVRVDDEGRANFLSDLYDLDAPRLELIAQRYEESDALKVADEAQTQQLETFD